MWEVVPTCPRWVRVDTAHVVRTSQRWHRGRWPFWLVVFQSASAGHFGCLRDLSCVSAGVIFVIKIEYHVSMWLCYVYSCFFSGVWIQTSLFIILKLWMLHRKKRVMFKVWVVSCWRTRYPQCGFLMPPSALGCIPASAGSERVRGSFGSRQTTRA